MPISGSTKALMYSRLSKMRLGASRLDYYQPFFYLTINGTNRRNNVRVKDIAIQDLLDGTPNTATLRVDGFTPTKGHEIKMGLGQMDAAHYIFCGHILSVDQVYEGQKPANIAYDLRCISYEWLLNRRKVTKRYTSTSASTIAADLLSTFASGFTTVHVERNLDAIDEITFTNEDLTTCLDRLAKRVGGYWYVDYAKDLHFFVTADSVQAGDVTTAIWRTAANVATSTDLSQVKTRVSVEGGGSTALVARAVGDTTLPIVDGVWYNTSGGTVVSGPQRITYTAKSSGGTGTTAAGKPLSPSAPSVSVPSGTSGNLVAGDRAYKVSFVTPAGESEVSSASSTATVSGISAPSAPSASVVSGTDGNLTGDINNNTRAYKVTFVTASGETIAGSASSTVTISGISAPSGSPAGSGTTGGSMALGSYIYYISYVTAKGETQGYGSPFAVTLTGGNNAVSITSIPTSSDARVTKRRIYRTGAGPNGLAQLITTLNDNTTTTYTDTTADASRGSESQLGDNWIRPTAYGQVSLTSIPTSGDARVTKRKIYRTALGGTTYKLLTTLSDNSTTTFADNVADESLGADAPSTDTSGSGQVNLSSIATGPTGTTARKLWRTEGGGAVYKFLATLSNNTATTYTDNIADGSLGETAPTESHVGGSAGDTTLRVADCSVVSSSGGWVQVSSQVLRFTGRSTSSGEGNLTGVPASGVGAIVAAIPFGSSVVNAPFLSGIPASGAGSIQYAIAAGDDVNLFVTADDTTAQSNMAGFVGGDGIHEDYLQDRRLSETEATLRASTQLDIAKDPLVSVRYDTRDQSTRSGRTVTFNLSAPTSISGTFKIQSVSITSIDPLERIFPFRAVEASSRRFTFEQLLRLVRAS